MSPAARPSVNRRPDALVLGGGIIGLAVARELAGRGLAVELLERDRPGCHASSAAAGMLAPLAEVPEPGPMFDACRAARDLWPGWVEELVAEAGREIEYDRSGALVVARNEAEVAALDGLREAAANLGEEVRPLALADARELVPDLAPDVEQAVLLPGDHRVDNVQVCDALARAAARRGVAVRSGAEVTRVAVLDGGVRVTVREGSAERQVEAAALILAAGAWSGAVPGLPKLPVRPLRGQMLCLGEVRWPWQGSVRAGHRYAVHRALSNAVPRAGTLLVGATAEDAGFAAVNTPAGLLDLAGFVGDLFPALVERPVLSVWAGLRPSTPDGLPLLGPLPGAQAVVAATGHHRNGILLAPWTAERVAAGLAAGSAAEWVDSFSPARFSTAESV